MNCSDVESLLPDAWGGELTEHDQKALNDHIVVCHRCQEEYTSGQSAVALARRIPGPQAAQLTMQRGQWGVATLRTSVESSFPRRLGRFRFAASIFLAFVAGYAFHAGLILMNPASRPSDEYRAPTPVIAEVGGRSRSLQATLVSMYRQNPGASQLANGMMAVFGTGG